MQTDHKITIPRHIYSLLCLGDSFTIGESVPLHEGFPYQTVQLLRKKEIHFHAPEIIAKTGWTTSELAEYISHIRFSTQYNFVTLLIGVNNQYHGLSMEEYRDDFTFLLRKAIHFTGEKPNHVIVLSIPDWSATPFAKGRDKEKIRNEIEQFNSINKKIVLNEQAHYIDITASGEEATGRDTALIAPDGLHPSGKEYAKWANKLSEQIGLILGSAPVPY